MAGDGEETRERLIEAGERLFAQKGVDGVTVAEIHAAAKAKNASALHYHFGSRQGLLIAVIERHQRDLDGMRAAMLADIEDADDGERLRLLIEVLARPQSAKLGTKRGRAYLRLVPQVMHLGSGPGDASMVSRSLARTIEMVRAELGDLPPAVADHRVEMLLGSIASAMSNRAIARERGKPELSDNDFVSDVVSMMLEAMRAPVAG